MIFINLLLYGHRNDLVSPPEWPLFMGQTKHRVARTARLKSWLKRVLHQILASFEDSGLVHYAILWGMKQPESRYVLAETRTDGNATSWIYVPNIPPRRARLTRLLPILAVLGCLACPAHLAGLAALFGLGWHSAMDHHDEPWWLVLLLVVGLLLPLVEVVFHRRHRCRHDH